MKSLAAIGCLILLLYHLIGLPLAVLTFEQSYNSTEHPYGHGVRHFSSIDAAYQEASISRMYGGIHYRDGVEEGTYQGEHVGKWVLSKLVSQPVIAAK